MSRNRRGAGDPRGRSRGARVRVRTARGRKVASTRWLERQLNDPFVAEARRLGYRSRAAFKLLELDEKCDLFRGRKTIVDLGAAPGGWTQVAIQKADPDAQILAVDILDMDPLPGATILKLDFLSAEAPARLLEALGDRKADVVMSDMAAPTTGHRQTDHLRTMALCEAAWDFAARVLADGGCFLAKVLRGGTEDELLRELKRHFATVRHVKPAASRKDSSELYVLATGFKGQAEGRQENDAEA